MHNKTLLEYCLSVLNLFLLPVPDFRKFVVKEGERYFLSSTSHIPSHYFSLTPFRKQHLMRVSVGTGGWLEPCMCAIIVDFQMFYKIFTKTEYEMSEMLFFLFLLKKQSVYWFEEN